MKIGLLSLIPWNFIKQRPHAFAIWLARSGHEVYFFEPPSISKNMRYVVNRFKQCLRPRLIEENIYLIPPVLVPNSKKFQRYLSLNRFFGVVFNLIIRRFKLDLFIVHEPEYADIVIRSGIPFLYDHIDDTHLFSTVVYKRTLENIQKLKEHSLFNCYIQRPEASKDRKGIFIPNGCSPEEFYPMDCEKYFDAVALSNISEWFDMDSVISSNKRILMIGPMDVDEGNNYEKYIKDNHGNVYWVPSIEKKIANMWVNMARVGIVPFKEDHPVTRYAIPVKILEYFLCNLPVVTYHNEGIEDIFGDKVVYYSSTGKGKSLDEAIAEAMKKKHGYPSFAKEFQWQNVVKNLETEICNRLSRS